MKKVPSAVFLSVSMLVIGFLLGYLLPEKVIQRSFVNEGKSYFLDNDVSLPFQTFTTYSWEKLLESAAPWAKEYMNEDIASQVESVVREKYAYRYEAATEGLHSDEDIADYMEETGILGEIAVSRKQAMELLNEIRIHAHRMKPLKAHTRAYMSDAPESPVRLPAEYEPIESVFVSFPVYFPSQWKTHVELISSIVREAEIIVLVPDEHWQKGVMLYLLKKGLDLDRVRFVGVRSDDVWVRDYGPTTVVQEDGSRAFIWNPYYLAYTSYHKFCADAAGDLGRFFDLPVYRLPAVVEGGNIITDGKGTIIMFDSVLKNNPDMDLKKLERVMNAYFGCTNLILLPHLKGEVTGHVDMVVKFIDDDTLMVIQSERDYPWHSVFEEVAQILSRAKACTGRNYEILRCRMPEIPKDSPNFWSYINSLTVNGSVIVPVFGEKEDSAALELYRKAMPGYKVVGIDFSNYPVGSVHCQTKEMYGSRR